MPSTGADPRPLWRAVNGAGDPRPSLATTVSAEVAIVGAGLAGLSAALALARAGKDVVVVDAVQSSSDGACASAGVIAPQLVRNTPRSVCRKLGRERGRALLRMIAESGTYAFELIRELGIDCAPQQAGFLAPVPGAAGLAKLREATAQWREFRPDLRVLDREETAAITGARGYAGTLVDETGGAVDPAALLIGLERVAVAAGARVFRGSPIVRVAGGRNGWMVEGERGRIVARTVLLCANGGNAALHPRLKGSALPLPVFEAATAPLPEEMRHAILPGGHSLTDISTDIFSIRFDRDGRLVTAYPYSPGADRTEVAHAINARLGAMLPAYRPQPIKYLWHGTAWINGSFLPRAVPLDDGLTAIQACNGRGIAGNLIAGREMARWIVDPRYQPMLPFEVPRTLPGFALLRHVPRLMMSASLAFKRTARRRPASRPDRD